MKLSQFLKELNEFYTEHGDVDCYYSHDDEGNGFQKVYDTAYLRYITPEDREEHIVESLYDEDEFDYLREEYDYDEEDINNLVKVCLVN